VSVLAAFQPWFVFSEIGGGVFLAVRYGTQQAGGQCSGCRGRGIKLQLDCVTDHQGMHAV
jgi:hypothetical protein